jgi:acetyl-CoA carboxylase biotin carboxyl carrier protein
VTIKRRPTAPEHQATTVYDLSEVDNAPFDSEVVSPESTTQLSINAAMVGLFHETDPRIVAGSVVSVGQTVGYIESMRLMNDVVSEVEGIVDLVVASDNLPVEYGQPLFALSAAT